MLVEVLLAVAATVEHMRCAVLLMRLRRHPVVATYERLLLRLHSLPLILHLIKSKLLIRGSCFCALWSQPCVHGILHLEFLLAILASEAVFKGIRVRVRVSYVI